MADSVEEGMLALQEEKRGLANQALAGGQLGDESARRLELSDLMQFFR